MHRRVGGGSRTLGRTTIKPTIDASTTVHFKLTTDCNSGPRETLAILPFLTYIGLTITIIFLGLFLNSEKRGKQMTYKRTHGKCRRTGLDASFH